LDMRTKKQRAGTRSTRASRLRWRRWISGLHDVVFLKWMAKIAAPGNYLIGTRPAR